MGDRRGAHQRLALAGKVADMVVLSADIVAEPEALEQARAVCTIVGGEIVSGGL